MKVFIVSLALFLAAFAGGCMAKTDAASRRMTDYHTSRNSLTWQGTYIGVVPCADCAGIETAIILDEDLTYRMRTRYLGKSDRVFERRGSFTWEENGNVIRLRGIADGPDRYHVGENRLIQLDRQGNRITGALAENYVLRKVDPQGGGS